MTLEDIQIQLESLCIPSSEMFFIAKEDSGEVGVPGEQIGTGKAQERHRSVRPCIQLNPSFLQKSFLIFVAIRGKIDLRLQFHKTSNWGLVKCNLLLYQRCCRLASYQYDLRIFVGQWKNLGFVGNNPCYKVIITDICVHPKDLFTNAPRSISSMVFYGEDLLNWPIQEHELDSNGAWLIGADLHHDPR